MKLIGRTNGKQVIASISHYDYVALGEGDDHISADGGQILTNKYAGYDRGWGQVIWFEVPQNFLELFNDYNYGGSKPRTKGRKYGIWNIEDVRILKKEEYPDVDSLEEKSQSFIWGTRGYVLLKDCSMSRLQAILTNVSDIRPETKEVIKYLISKNES